MPMSIARAWARLSEGEGVLKWKYEPLADKKCDSGGIVS